MSSRHHDKAEEDARRPLFVEDPWKILSRSVPLQQRSRACTHSSQSWSSADDADDDSVSLEAENQHNSYPMYRRVQSFPRVGSFSGPPRRPSRSTSLERKGQQELTPPPASKKNTVKSGRSSSIPSALHQPSPDENDESEEEFDRNKFLQLLFGTCSSESDDMGGSAANNLEDKDHRGSTCASRSDSFSFVKLRPRQSWGSAPPTLAGRRRYSCSSSTEKVAAISTDLATRQQSLPLAVFRPTQQVRNRRRRSLIQDMLTPDSETSSRSVRLPPRLPSRTGSDRSNTSNNCADPIPAILVLCNSALAVSSRSSISMSSSQRSTCEEAPKRPRRSLSPIFGESLRSLLQQQEEDDANKGEEPILRVVEGAPKKAKAPQSDTATTAITTAAVASSKVAPPTVRSLPRRRNTPVRAKTFSCITSNVVKETATEKVDRALLEMMLLGVSPACSQELMSNFKSCISLLAHNLHVGRDVTGVPIPELLLANDRKDSLWTATAWPAPRRTRVPLGRSKTFTSYQTVIAVPC
jgi:hypothetical protein